MMARDGMLVTLTEVKGPEVGRAWEFREPRAFLIGRARDADCRLPDQDPYVSRRHVHLEICPPGCRMRDIGMTNPAEVNDQPVTEECELKDGDVIKVGYTELQVSINGAIASEVRPCGGCGRPVELLPGEPAATRCAACEEVQRVRAAEAARARYVVRCSSCGTDLTARANSDGRAEELKDIAVYACERHVPRGEGGGATIGPYEVCGGLGEGGMGVVYLAYHRPTARVLVLKQMKDLTDPLLVKRFEREVRLLKGLAHQHVVRCVDAGIDAKGAPYLATEYVAGGSLEDEVVARGGRLHCEDAVNLTCQVLEGLEYIHTKSIVHRDIKPPNVLLLHLTTTGGPERRIAKLADFGLAVCYARAGGTRVTKRDTALGTLMFMPPEQVRDAGSVREPADIYAVGVTLYYLLTGRYTFDFPTPADVLEFRKRNQEAWKRPQEALQLMMRLQKIMHPFRIILEETPIPIRQREASIPPKLAEVVDRAVQKEARARFQSAAEFRTALQQAMR